MISVHDHRELKAATAALKRMDRGLRNEINRATTREFSPVWKQVVNSQATYKQDADILAKGARLAGGNPPTLYAATSRRKMRGGLVPAEKAGAFEFGAVARNAKRKYNTRSKKGKTYTVNRRTMRQLPARQDSGRVVYPAFAHIAPRIASLWTKLVVRMTFDAMEGKG